MIQSDNAWTLLLYSLLYLSLILLQCPSPALCQRPQAPGLLLISRPPRTASDSILRGENLRLKAAGLQPKQIAPQQPYVCLVRNPRIPPICGYQTPSRLHASPAARSEDFNVALKQGGKLLQHMKNFNSQESAFNDFAAFERWGWKVSRTEQSWLWRFITLFLAFGTSTVHFALSSLFEAMKALKVSTTSPPNVRRNAQQSDWFKTNDGVERVSSTFLRLDLEDFNHLSSLAVA